MKNKIKNLNYLNNIKLTNNLMNLGKEKKILIYIKH